MAITKLNSLAIPAGTVEPADISYPLTNFSSTGIDDNASSTVMTLDNTGVYSTQRIQVEATSSSSVELLKLQNMHSSGGVATQYLLPSVSHSTAFLDFSVAGGYSEFVLGTGTLGSEQTAITQNTSGTITFATLSQNETMRIDSSGNVGINESTPSGLTGNTSGVGTSSKFKVTGSVGSTQIANTGNLIAFSRDDANYISATGSSASLIYDSPTHYFKSGTNTYATLTDNLVLDGGLVQAEEFRYTAGTGRRVSKYSGISSYWNQNEYIELFTVTPGGASQNYFVEGCIKAQSSHNLDIVRFSVAIRSNTLPAIVYLASYDRERYGNDFNLKPFIWHDTTNGVIKVAVKNQSTIGIHNAEFELNISARTTAQARDNVSYSGAERTAVTSGFTEQDTFILRKNSYVNDTYYFERHDQRPHLHGTPYGTDGQIATGMRVRQSNHLSFVTDRVTVPIAGIYLITFNSLSSNNNQNRTDINIRVNGSTVSADLDMAQATNDYSGKSTQVAVDLAANDYIQFFNTDWYTSTPSTFDNWQQVSITYIG